MNCLHTLSFTAAFAVCAAASAQSPPGEQPNIRGTRITQGMITSGSLSLHDIRNHGLRMFSTPFNKLDGYGDGPVNPLDPTSPGGRPTLQNNGTLLRVNGLDSQTCMECHSVMSTAQAPFRFGIGGFGGANNNAIFQPKTIDVADTQGNGFAAFDGRFINPPFLFGSGGVELVGKEMTIELQQRKAQAQQNPGTSVRLVAKGIDFGVIKYNGTSFDTSGVVGVDDDLVVKPFGRKGEFATTRAFDVGALQFHLGMQPIEAVGRNVDGDGDGVVNEVLVGELSAMHIFDTTLERPRRDPLKGDARHGERLFSSIGCADCHTPVMTTRSPMLTYSYPLVDTDPTANIYYAVNLSQKPTRFPRADTGGIRVNLYSDLKRHDMGPGLAESFGQPLDSQFVTARLWGIADSGPYLHDGRALTLTDAILLHGGEAQTARNNFAALSGPNRVAVLSFLRTLRTPEKAAVGLSTTNL